MFRLFQGSEFQMAVSVMWGAAGCVPAIANIIPGLCSDLYAAAVRNDAQQALALQQKVTDISNALFGARFPSSFFCGLKYALRCMGICGETASKPFLPLCEREKRGIRSTLDKYDIG